MTLLHAAGLGLAFGSRTVFDALTLTIEEGERVGLVGVNGAGKSSLMKMLARVSEPDRGELQLRRGATVTYLPQEPIFPETATVASELEVARAPLRAALDEHHGALLLVTHDRYFLDDLVDRIIEITPGAGVTSFPGNYEAYLEQKLLAEDQQELDEHKRDRWIAQEVAWLRRGPEARRTKSKARIERARRLMAERGFTRPKVADFKVAAPPRLSATVIEAEGLRKRFGDRVVLAGVDFRLKAGERVGLVGPNGVGKTTFLKILLGELPPDAGSVVTGKRTQVAYYDQQRAALDGEQTAYEAAGGRPPGRVGEDFIELSGRRVVLRDYLDDLLFPPSIQKMQVKALSGGERNRLLLARLFLQGANVLVLDEPTNDLDLVTL